MQKPKRAPQRTTKPPSGARKPFEVLVAATVSAGKSSLINALIGQELLHAANEATTACVTRVEHCSARKTFTATCHDSSGSILARRRRVSAELVRTWNADSRVNLISLKGNFRSAPLSSSGLVIYDTPGPNNSGNDGHGQAARSALRGIPARALFYVLNAGHLGTRDDRAFLDVLRDQGTPERPVYFVLNKVDLLDPEKGESIAAHVRQAHSYLVDAGFENPAVIPTIADAALYARQALNQVELTRVQRSRLRRTLDEFSDRKRELIEASIVPDVIRKRLLKELDSLEKQNAAPKPSTWLEEKNQLQQLVVLSGIRTVETIIQHGRTSLGRK